MLRQKLFVCFTMFFCASIAPTASAEAVFSFVGPYQASPSNDLPPVFIEEGEFFERDPYEGIGTIFSLFVDTFEAYPEDGDTWFVGLDQVSPNIRLAETSVSYDAQQDCLLFQGTPFLCEIRGRVTSGTARYTVTLLFHGKCLETTDYGLAVDFQTDGIRQELEGSPLPFQPVRFTPKVAQTFMASSIEPRRLRGASSGGTNIAAFITDNLDCGRFLQDAKVTISTTVQPGSNAEPYFMTGDFGTGRFTSLGFDSVVNPGDIDNLDTVIEGSTNENGFFNSRYTAQVHGAIETVTIKPWREKTETEPEIRGETATRELRIEIPGLVEITRDSGHIAFADGGSCPHSPLPHWMTPNTRSRMIGLAAIYHHATGHLLSLNDASLPLGGIIAEARIEANPEAASDSNRCHFSHRQGVDIDVNQSAQTIDEQGGIDYHLMAKTTVTFRQREESGLDYLIYWVNRFGGIKIDEEPIHFRFPN